MMFQALDKIDRKLRLRLEEVAMKADRFGERGIVDWAKRTTQDALMLGRVRDRDVAALERLEDTFGHDFYNGNAHINGANAIYA